MDHESGLDSVSFMEKTISPDPTGVTLVDEDMSDISRWDFLGLTIPFFG